MPLAAVAGIGAAGSLISGAIGSNAAGNAASAQANAANNAANLQYQASQNALGFQEQQYNQQQANEAPWLQSGVAAESNLDYLLGISPPTTQGTMTGAMQGGQGTAGAPGSMARSTAAPSGMTAGGSGDTGWRLSPMGGANTQASGLSMANQGAGGQPNSMARSSGVSGMTNVPGSGLASAPGPSGSTNMGSMVNPSLGGFGSLSAPYQGQFTAPTGLTMQNDPGYQARLQLGTQALQQSAAARGDVVTGGTANDLNQYAQNFASNEYGNVYNRALDTYGTNYNQYQQQQAKQYNQLAALAGVGQQTAQQLGYAGQNASSNVSNNLLNTGQQMGQDYQNAGAANASGYIGSANALGGALGGVSNNMSNLMLMKGMMGGNSGMNTTPSAYNGLL